MVIMTWLDAVRFRIYTPCLSGTWKTFFCQAFEVICDG
jgi:hypothetical protein